MQCKDIPDLPIMQFLDNDKWANWFELEGPGFNLERSVRLAMPALTPGKLVLAKMKQLIARGLVDGCGCGCRGNFELTDKGRAWLTAQAVQTGNR